MSITTLPAPVTAPAAGAGSGPATDVPPTLKIWATYPPGTTGPDCIEITVDDHGGPADAEFVVTVLAALMRRGPDPQAAGVNFRVTNLAALMRRGPDPQAAGVDLQVTDDNVTAPSGANHFRGAQL